MTKNVIVDIDGVLADFEGEFCRVFDCYKNRHLVNLEERLPDKAQVIYEWIANPYVYQYLEPIALGIEVVHFLDSSGLDVCLVSSRPTVGGMFRITFEWLLRNRIPFASLSIGAGNKVDAVQRLRPVMIIDDIPEILEKSRSLGVFSVIFNQPWNKSANFPRISKIQDLQSCEYLQFEMRDE